MPVRFSASGVCTEVATRAASPLADGTMLRILAFRRVGESPDLSTDKYMGEGTYKAINGDGTLAAVSSLLLRTGTYDFYALTPDLAVADAGRSGAGVTCAVSVGHGVDLCHSATPGQTVSEASPARCTPRLEQALHEAHIRVAAESGQYHFGKCRVCRTDQYDAGACNGVPALRVTRCGSCADRCPYDSGG